MRLRIWALPAVLAALGATASVASADAKTSDYHPNAQARNFAGGAGGWSAQATYEGALCIPALTCPLVTDNYQPSGGGDGASDGFLETKTAALANAGVASRVDGVWESPAFTYNGAEGSEPDRVSFSLDRRDDTAALLNVAGGAATYSVEIVEGGSGNVVAKPVDGKPLDPAAAWTSIDSAGVNPAKLKIGHDYRIRITSQFATSGAEAVPAATAGYDNVVLEATLAPSSGGGGGTGGGGTGGGPVFLNWHRLIVKTNCPKSLHAHTCLIHMASYVHGFSGVHPTRSKTVRRHGHHPKRVTLRVRPKYNDFGRSLGQRHGRLRVHLVSKAHHKARSKNARLRVIAFKKP